MRERPIGVVVTILAVVAVGLAPAAFVVLDAGRTARPGAPASSKGQRTDPPRQQR
jgi:hypothetical protein